MKLPDDPALLSDDQLAELVSEATGILTEDRKQNQLLYYKPTSHKVQAIHDCKSKVIGVGGGNGSGKSESMLVDLVMTATGVFPYSQRHLIDQKFRGPIPCRLVVESLTTTLETIILPKLQWWKWSGVDAHGGERGHWGWIPKSSLIDGSWEKSWSAKLRVLRLICRDPHNPAKVLGESTIQCLRADQRVSMFDGSWKRISDLAVGHRVASGDGSATRVTKTYHLPKAPLYRIKTSRGREIVATSNHLHFLSDGSTKTTDELTIKDILLVALPLDSRKRKSSMLDWQLGWLAIMLGDGCMRGRQAVFTAKPGNKVLMDLPPLPPNTKLHQSPSHPWDFFITLKNGRRDNPLVMFLKKQNLWGLGSKDKYVPDIVFRQPPKSIGFFLRNLWNCDGWINHKGRQGSYTTISRRLAYDIKYLLWNIGIYASVTVTKGICGFTGKAINGFHVTVSGGSFCRFDAALSGKDFESIAIKNKGRNGVIQSIDLVAEEPVFCIDTETHSFVVDGLVTHNCMSQDQDATDFASGDFAVIAHDEPPKLAQWRENEARTMRMDGRMILAMTWPDDPSINVDWLYNEVYEPGRSGSDPQISWFELWTTENKNLKQESVAAQAAKWSKEISNVRIYGRPIRFSNRIHPEFTDCTKTWCFRCDKSIIPVPQELHAVGVEPKQVCPECHSENISEYNHVEEFETGHAWPTIFVIDPHPRKPHAYLWVQISPSDDWYVVADGSKDGDCAEVKKDVDRVEQELGIWTAQRLTDPNMGRSPAGQKRGVTWQDEFGSAGLMLDLADDIDVGRARINTMLKPDERTLRPRLIIHPRCRDTIYQLSRYTWGEFSKNVERDVKQQPKDTYSDYPTCLKYMANSDPCFRMLKDGAPVVGRRRKGSHG